MGRLSYQQVLEYVHQLFVLFFSLSNQHNPQRVAIEVLNPLAKKNNYYKELGNVTKRYQKIKWWIDKTWPTSTHIQSAKSFWSNSRNKSLDQGTWSCHASQRRPNPGNQQWDKQRRPQIIKFKTWQPTRLQLNPHTSHNTWNWVNVCKIWNEI